MTERKVLETDRLRLEPVGPEHVDAIWTAVESSLAELRPWMPWAVDNSRESTEEFAQGCVADWGVREWQFGIHKDGVYVGGIGLQGHAPLTLSAELGYWLRSDQAGNGYMTEAAEAMVRFGFNELGLHRIELAAGVENLASIRVAEKLGFVRGGVLRDRSRGADGWYDCYVFDLLEKEWRG
jgi:ribosomal-protein-serine acetyltransferase